MKDKPKFQDNWERSPGFVYFIAAGSPPAAIKIGVTTHAGLAKRLSGIQGANHDPLHLLAVISTAGSERPMKQAESIEKELHRRFAHLQRFEHGWAGSEWFTAAPELIEFISSNAEPPESYEIPVMIARLGPGLAS